MKNTYAVAFVNGEIVDMKMLTTERGKHLAHIQVENADGRTSVLIPEKIFRKTESQLKSSFSARTPILIEGTMERSKAQNTLIAERVAKI